MVEVSQAQTVRLKSNNGTKKIIRNCSIFVLASLFGYLHYRYAQQLHENAYHFSHMSALEREMALATEMGFYYSYYKTVVQERPFIVSISKIMYDRLVEYPKAVNGFNRFNIHPEVILGATYRYFEEVLNTSRICHLVNRGGSLPPVESCEGIGEPMMFYLQGVWLLAGLLVAVMFVFATELSGCIIGGIVAVFQYFANHSESTRVMWTPNERENFAVPLLCLQMYLITVQLREDKRFKTSFRLQVSIFVLNCLCLLFWQFTQFIFLTQTAILFVMEQLKVIDLKTFCVFLHSHFCGLHMAVLLLQGNDMLKTSLYTSFFLVVSCYCLFFSTFRVKVQTKLDLLGECWLIFLRIGIVTISSIHVKKILSDFFEVQEDNHIWDLLYSKFSDYKSFHTLIYSCSETFDFLPFSYFVNTSYTCLLPLALFGIVNVFSFWIFNGFNAAENFQASKKQTKADEHKMAVENKMTVCKDGAKDSDTDDSGIENNSESNTNNSQVRRSLDDICNDKPNEPELPVDRFVYSLKNMNVDPGIFYNISQLVVFGIMAWLFMRLKMLFSTQMCIVSSVAFNTKYDIGTPRILRWVVLLSGLASLCMQGYHNIYKEISNLGEFSDIHTEELINWINRETSTNEVFAASMPTSATVLLTTRRAIVTHPHYEHLDNRKRAYAVYKMYGRFSPLELYQELTKLSVTYLILEKKLCYWKSTSTKESCGHFVNIWDADQPSYTGRPELCKTLFNEVTDHFYMVFSNDMYAVFRIHDLSVQYMPRVFDT